MRSEYYKNLEENNMDREDTKSDELNTSFELFIYNKYLQLVITWFSCDLRNCCM